MIETVRGFGLLVVGLALQLGSVLVFGIAGKWPGVTVWAIGYAGVLVWGICQLALLIRAERRYRAERDQRWKEFFEEDETH